MIQVRTMKTIRITSILAELNAITPPSVVPKPPDDRVVRA